MQLSWGAMGRPSQAMKKFTAMLSKIDLKSKKVAVFGTYARNERLLTGQ